MGRVRLPAVVPALPCGRPRAAGGEPQHFVELARGPRRLRRGVQPRRGSSLRRMPNPACATVVLTGFGAVHLRPSCPGSASRTLPGSAVSDACGYVPAAERAVREPTGGTGSPGDASTRKQARALGVPGDRMDERRPGWPRTGAAAAPYHPVPLAGSVGLRTELSTLAAMAPTSPAVRGG